MFEICSKASVLRFWSFCQGCYRSIAVRGSLPDYAGQAGLRFGQLVCPKGQEEDVVGVTRWVALTQGTFGSLGPFQRTEKALCWLFCVNQLISALPTLNGIEPNILKCNDGSFYTGSTLNLEKRINEHQTGNGSIYTKRRLPIELVFSLYFERIDDAYFREKQIQGWSRRKKLALITGKFELLSELSKSRKKT